jgi:hypothetical protein
VLPLTGTNTLRVRSVDFASAEGNVAVANSKTTSPSVTLASATLPLGLAINSELLGRKITAISGAKVTLDGNANAGFGLVTVQASAVNSAVVTLTSATLPSGLAPGSTLLGRTVLAISDTMVTLNGVANQAIAAPTDVAFTPVVEVSASALNSNVVTVESVPALLAPGATLLGRSVTNIVGHSITLSGNANAAVGTVTVKTSSTSSPVVTVAAVPPALVAGSALLGQSVNAIVGNTVTLSGHANAATTVATPRAFTSPRACSAGVPFTTSERLSPVVTSTFTVLRNLKVDLAGTGTVTSGFANTSYREVGKSFTITATATAPPVPTVANPGSVFVNWSVSNYLNPGLTQKEILAQIGVAASSLEKAALTFIFREGLVLQANFQTNPFPASAGTYNGLVHADAVLPHRSGSVPDGTLPGIGTEGYFNVTVNSKGAFSARLTIDGAAFSFAGAFDNTGVARFGAARLLAQVVARPNKPSLSVALHTSDTNGDTAGGQQILGTIMTTEFQKSVLSNVSNIVAEKAFFGAQVGSGSISVGSPVVSMVSTAERTAGEVVTGAGIPAGTTVQSVDSPTQLTLSANATVKNAVASLNFTRNVDPAYLGATGGDGMFTLLLPARAPHYQRDVTFDQGADTVDVGAENEFEDGSRVVFEDGGALPPALTAGQEYFVVNKSGGTFQVSPIRDGTPVDIDVMGHAAALLDPSARQVPGLEKQDYPQGTGTGTLKVTKAGVVIFTGSLADGTAVTASSTVSSAYQVPLFAHLYTFNPTKGLFSTLVKLDSTQVGSDLKPSTGSRVLWSRPFMLNQYYPGGWTQAIDLDLMGAKYNATGTVLKQADGFALNGPDVVNGNAGLGFYDGQLSEDLIKMVSISTTNGVTKVPDPADQTFSLTINAALGSINGSFVHTDNTVPTYKGIIYQKGPNAGAFGYFLTRPPAVIDYTGQSGGVSLIGAP